MRLAALSCTVAIASLAAVVVAAEESRPRSPQSSVAPTSPSKAPSSAEKPAEAAKAVTVKDGRLSVRVENLPLAWVLEEIARQGKFAVIAPSGPSRRRVSVQFQDLPMDEGVRQILRGNDAFFFYGVDGTAPASLKAVWVYPKGRGRGLQPVPPETWASTAEVESRLSDPDSRIRAQAVESLVERKGDEARDAVVDALRDQDDQVRTRALYHALSGGVNVPTDLLTELALSDSSTDVRFLALDALAKGPEARTIAETTLNDPNPRIRQKAKEMLSALDAPPRSRRRSQPSQDR